MKEKKLFGIGAVVLMILVAFAPAINGAQLIIEKMNVSENENIIAGSGNWDLKITFEEAIFENYHEKEDIAYYKIKYTIENVGDGLYIGKPRAVLKVHNNDWELASWEWPKDLPLILGKDDDPVAITVVKGIDYDNEIFLTGRIADLETGLLDEQGLEDPDQSNNVGFATGNFWDKLNERGYEPSGNHLEACRPHEQWIDHNETIEFPNYPVEIPIFKDVYAKIIIPTFLGCDRLGWLGKTVQLLLDIGRALCNCSAATLEVLACIALLVGELYAGILGVIALVEGIVSGNVLLEAVVVAGLFLDLKAIAVTLELLLGAIDDIPNQGDPEVKELRRSVHAFLSYYATYPWTHDIEIFGEINNCKVGEIVDISCRNVENRDIPGEQGKRIIDPFNVSSDFNLAKYRDHLIMRNCQVTIKGSRHTPLTTRRIFSYAAPGGSLNAIAGFKPTSRSVDRPLNSCLQRFLEIFPFLKQILSPYFFQPVYD